MGWKDRLLIKLMSNKLVIKQRNNSIATEANRMLASGQNRAKRIKQNAI